MGKPAEMVRGIRMNDIKLLQYECVIIFIGVIVHMTSFSILFYPDSIFFTIFTPIPNYLFYKFISSIGLVFFYL